MTGAVAPACRNCMHFDNDPATIEAVFKGMSALSSAWGSVRADDGLCRRNERYLSAHAFCPEFVSAAAT